MFATGLTTPRHVTSNHSRSRNRNRNHSRNHSHNHNHSRNLRLDPNQSRQRQLLAIRRLRQRLKQHPKSRLPQKLQLQR